MCGAFRDPAAKASATLADGWAPRPEHELWSLKTPISWLADPFDDRNWRFQLNAWRPLDVLVTAHSTTRDDIWLQPLADLMLDWASFEATHANDPELWNDMGSGLRAAKLAYLISQPGLEEQVGGKRRDALILLARRHLARLRDRTFIGDSNHGLFQVHGAMALIKTLTDAPEAEGGEAYIEGVFDDLLDRQFSPEGVHLEHSPGYQHFVLKTLERLRHSGWYESMGHVTDVIDRARYSLRWFVFPDGLLSRIGDSSPVKTPAKWWPRPPGVMGQLYDKAGYAIIRTTAATPAPSSSMLLVTGGHHSNVHKHADDLSFELFERGRLIVVDSGKYSYSRKAWRDFTDSAAAHNSVDLIPERLDNGVRASRPVGSAVHELRTAQWGWVVEGGFERPEFGVSHHRRFLYRPGEWLVLIDKVARPERAQMTAWLHLAPDLEAAPTEDGWRFPGGTVTYAVDQPSERRRYRGQEIPKIQGWMAGGYHHRTPNDALALAVTADQMELATIVDLTPDGSAPVGTFEGGALTLTWRGRPIVEQGRVLDLSPSQTFWGPRPLTS